MKYEQTRKDYETLRDIMGTSGGKAQVYDFTGGFVFEDHAMELLENPTKAQASKLYESMIIYGFQAGWDNGFQRLIPDLQDPAVDEIASRYGF